MFNPKSTIYQTEWLDLVFANRNKTYGAYELRQNSNKRLIRALFIASIGVSALFSYPLIKHHFQKDVVDPIIQQDIETIVDLASIPPLKQREEPSAPAASSPKSEPVKLETVSSLEPVVVSNPVVDEPPKQKDLLNSVISNQTTDGQATTSNAGAIQNGDGDGTGPHQGITGSGTGNEPVNISALQKYPEFPGGVEAFMKFLRRNLRYPDRAQKAEIGGKVFVSFVVERDGSLTDIKILRGIGYGCDEEAIRVFKKSPAWNPGFQNDRAVRVLYTIPLVFQLSE